MRYVEFRDLIQGDLRRRTRGSTWSELRERLALPYERPCPTWMKRLEQDIGLVRTPGKGRAYVWTVSPLAKSGQVANAADVARPTGGRRRRGR